MIHINNNAPNSPVNLYCAFDAPLDATTSVLPRWKRKALEAQDANTPTKTPGKGSAKTPGVSAIEPPRSFFTVSWLA
jgi:hypothetical protein